MRENRCMPVHYVIARERRLIVSAGEGVVTFEEIKVHQDRLLADNERDPHVNHLIDMVAVNRLMLSIEEAKLLVRAAIRAPGSRRAPVASENPCTVSSVPHTDSLYVGPDPSLAAGRVPHRIRERITTAIFPGIYAGLADSPQSSSTNSQPELVSLGLFQSEALRTPKKESSSI